MAFDRVIRFMVRKAMEGSKEHKQELDEVTLQYPEATEPVLNAMWAYSLNGSHQPAQPEETGPHQLSLMAPEPPPPAKPKITRHSRNRTTRAERERIYKMAPPGFLYCVECKAYKEDNAFQRDKARTERRGRRIYCQSCSDRLYGHRKDSQS